MEPCIFCEFQPVDYNGLVDHLVSEHPEIFTAGRFQGYCNCVCGEVCHLLYFPLHLEHHGGLQVHALESLLRRAGR